MLGGAAWHDAIPPRLRQRLARDAAPRYRSCARWRDRPAGTPRILLRSRRRRASAVESFGRRSRRLLSSSKRSYCVKLSLVMPARNEEGCLPTTLDRFTQVLRDRGIPFEIIVVDDG